ncbi:CHAT domain-containing protein [Scytonema sp. NUACC21]
MFNLFEILNESENESQLLKQFLKENLDKLDDSLPQILQDWATELLTVATPEEAKARGEEIGNFSDIIRELSFGSRANNRELSFGSRANNIDIAVTGYKIAVQIFTYYECPEQWARFQNNTQNNLGVAYQERIQGNPTENLEQALICYKKALQVYTFNAFPMDCLRTGRNMGDAAFSVRLWLTAIESYTAAINAVEKLRSWSSSELRRQKILKDALDIYANMVQACINAGQIEKAFEYAERSRSKRLVDLMVSHDLYKAGEIPPEVENLLQQYNDLQQKIDEERDRTGKNKGSSNTRATWQAYNQAVATLETAKQKIWENIRRLDPVLAGEIQVAALDFAQMQQLIDQPTTAILSFYTTSNDTHIFVLQQNQITLHTCMGQGLETLQNWIFQNWLIAYVSDRDNWTNQINTILDELAQRLQLTDLIVQHLKGIEELIVVPHLTLHQIPFAALPIKDHEYLGDKFLIRYIPSCQILEFCQERGEVANALSYGLVEDANNNLPCANFEGEQIAQLYNIPLNRRLRGTSQATKAKYRQLAEQVQVLHSCHHAESCLYEPLESVLKLGDGDITLGQLMTPSWRLPNLSDVFLACCETHLGIPSLTDDILTLSTGFLCAGARSVLSTLWSVNDLATGLFSSFYYQHRKHGKSRPTALQQAQIQLRSLSKEDIKQISQQALAIWREARKKISQYPPDSQEYLEWHSKYQAYGRVLEPLNTAKNSQEQFPFSHPCYWSAFICSGLR